MKPLIKTNILRILFILIISLPMSCSDFVTIDPPQNEIVSKMVFTTDASATAAVTGIYSLMASSQSFINGDLELYTGLSSDELASYSAQIENLEFSENALSVSNSIVRDSFWKEPYRYINNANAVLEGLSGSAITQSTKNQLEGEARFIRALCNFYLTNLFGDVPLITSSDYKLNQNATRLPKEDVYMSIIEDLTVAKDLLASDFHFSADERVRPNKYAAIALLARVYLYLGKWEKAEDESSLVIDNSPVYSLESDLQAVFLNSSSEAIWQLKPVEPGKNTQQGVIFIVADGTTLGQAYLNEDFINSFEEEDARLTNWIGIFDSNGTAYYYPFKYKIYLEPSVTEYSIVLRVAEQYLIRAEAKAHLDDVTGAKNDLNAIRHRAGLSNTAANDQSSLLTAIEEERRFELFAEGGHRWLDLKRANHADAILQPLKEDWQPTDALYPIPDSERRLNTALSQNLGY